MYERKGLAGELGVRLDSKFFTLLRAISAGSS